MINDVHKDAVLRTIEPSTAFSNAMADLLGTGPLDYILVDHFGSKVPLPRVAHVNTDDSTSLVAAFDDMNTDAVVLAIAQAGFQVRVSARLIRVTALQPNPQELVAMIDEQAEQARAQVLAVYSDLNDQCRAQLAEGTFNEDEARRTRSAVERFTDEALSHIHSTATLHKAMATGRYPVPPADTTASEFLRFAYTYDGYAAINDNSIELGRAVGQIRQSWDEEGELPNDLNLLRTCLFLQARAHSRRADDQPVHEQPFLRALVTRIRDVSGGTVPWPVIDRTGGS
ncbi:ribosome recycling factor [Nocardia salmonicida]|uniref:ribosome recycling factor n=1 Tax=Nocardia salmonicida TaxID=53431 RepID=UPI003792F786